MRLKRLRFSLAEHKNNLTFFDKNSRINGLTGIGK